MSILKSNSTTKFYAFVELIFWAMFQNDGKIELPEYFKTSIGFIPVLFSKNEVVYWFPNTMVQSVQLDFNGVKTTAYFPHDIVLWQAVDETDKPMMDICSEISEAFMPVFVSKEMGLLKFPTAQVLEFQVG